MSDLKDRNTSSAAGPAAGYFYQLRYALLSGLQLHPKYPTGKISIELIDDVSFTHDQIVVDSQLKHSIKLGGKLTKNSPALWRTLAIWIDQRKSSKSDMYEFHLVSTAEIPLDDPLKFLAAGNSRDTKAGVLEALKEAARKSTNAASEKDRKVFLDTPDDILSLLLKRITVFENMSNLGNLATEIDELLYWACEPECLEQLREDLEGWWVNRIFASWAKQEGAEVILEEIATKIHFLKKRLVPSELILDVPDTECGEILEERNFVKQLRLVTSRAERIRISQKAYLRAATQRSKWVRQFEIDPAELEDYDDRLFERWDAHQIGLVDELNADATEEDILKVGRAILHWAETSEVEIRNIKSTYLTSGSYQALSDSMRVGWHPDFEKQLKSS